MNNFFALVAAALLGLAKMTDLWYLLVLGRLVIGFNCGLNSGLVPMYLTEVRAPVPTPMTMRVCSSRQSTSAVPLAVSSSWSSPSASSWRR